LQRNSIKLFCIYKKEQKHDGHLDSVEMPVFFSFSMFLQKEFKLVREKLLWKFGSICIK